MRVALQKILSLILAITLCIHIITSFWILIGEMNDESWIHVVDGIKQNDEENIFFYAYPSSLYFTVMTFTTIGFGDIAPKTNAEIWFIMALELVGLWILNTVMSRLISIKFWKDSANRLFEKRMQIIQKHLT